MTEPETSSILHPSKLPTPKLKTSPIDQKSSSIALSSILYKLIFIVLIAILPGTRVWELLHLLFVGIAVFWELLHLLFVGIAVSYGIFSQRNADTGMEKDSQQKDESPRSFVSQMLQVSPVFDDEDDSGVVDSKMQTWNSQFYRNEPETLVAKEAGITTKHLLLPASLKPSNSPEGPSTGRSVRPFRPQQSQSTTMEGEDEEEAPNSGSGAEEYDVDKKADEFLARYREQIRLQRIESIKRSTKPRSNSK